MLEGGGRRGGECQPYIPVQQRYEIRCRTGASGRFAVQQNGGQVTTTDREFRPSVESPHTTEPLTTLAQQLGVSAIQVRAMSLHEQGRRYRRGTDALPPAGGADIRSRARGR